MEDIDTVYSHPQGFAQCRPFFNEHRDWKLKPYFSTSQSAERVSKAGKKKSSRRSKPDGSGAVWAFRTERKYLFNENNYTRFFHHRTENGNIR